jgi:uracil phosphoribosyltransferase
MLATGGSAVQALTVLKQNGAIHPALICIVSSPAGVAEVERQHPGTVIHTAAHDRALNAKKYILPGLGDFGDRLYGT